MLAIMVKKKTDIKEEESKKTKLIIFDMQGTLIENGVYPSPLRQTKQILGLFKMPFPEFVKEFEKIFMTKNFTDYSEAFDIIFAEMNINPEEYNRKPRLVGLWNKNKLLSKPFEETLEVLDELKKGYKLAIVANCDFGSKEIIEKFKLTDYFDATFLSCESGMLKNDAETFAKIVKKLKVKPEEALMVGDSIESDIEPAKQAGLKTILLDRRNTREYEGKISSLKELSAKL